MQTMLLSKYRTMKMVKRIKMGGICLSKRVAVGRKTRETKIKKENISGNRNSLRNQKIKLYLTQIQESFKIGSCSMIQVLHRWHRRVSPPNSVAQPETPTCSFTDSANRTQMTKQKLKFHLIRRLSSKIKIL